MRSCAASPGTSTGQLWKSAGTLHAMLERIALDLASGHVLAVTGLELQVRRYLTHAQPEPDLPFRTSERM